jgi:hypothetical protein
MNRRTFTIRGGVAGAKGVKVNEVKDDLFGPGSAVKWFSVEDPDGNQVMLVQPRGK